MFISPAFAQTVADAGADMGGFSVSRLVFQLLAIFAVFYFILVRPQQKKMRAHQRMLDQVQKGSHVIFGGMMGKVVKVLNDQEVLVEIADGVEVKVLRSYVSEVVSEMDTIDGKPQPKQMAPQK